MLREWAKGCERGVLQERAAIVRWLRGLDNNWLMEDVYAELADRIEAGEHHHTNKMENNNGV